MSNYINTSRRCKIKREEKTFIQKVSKHVKKGVMQELISTSRSFLANVRFYHLSIGTVSDTILNVSFSELSVLENLAFMP